MMRTQAELAGMVENFARVIRGAGLKMTPQRLEIYRQTAATTAHPDIESIHREVRRTMPGISLDTVYRTLDLFRELGLVSNLRPFPGPVRFDANTAPHHHFVCNRCGLTRDFTSPELDALEVPRSARALGQVESARVEVRGRCPACAAAGKAPAAKQRTTGTNSRRQYQKSTRRD